MKILVINSNTTNPHGSLLFEDNSSAYIDINILYIYIYKVQGEWSQISRKLSRKCKDYIYLFFENTIGTTVLGSKGRVGRLGIRLKIQAFLFVVCSFTFGG